MNPWLLGAAIYLAGGWLTLAFCTYACAKDPKTYLTKDFWRALVVSAIWPVAWPMAILVAITLIVLGLLKHRRGRQ